MAASCSKSRALLSLHEMGSNHVQVALVRVVGLDLGTTLCFTGLYNIISGVLFGIPMPVQPMKAIAAVAIADESITLTHVLAGGIFVSAVTFLLGVTRLINVFNRCCCRTVVLRSFGFFLYSSNSQH